VKQFRRYEVPAGCGAHFAEPPLEGACSLVRRNHDYLSKLRFTIGAIPFLDFRKGQQQEVLAKARKYTERAGVTLEQTGGNLIVETGHQPQFSHPGIWIKNFLCYHLASRLKGTGLNMIVDSDEARDCEIALPSFPDDAPLRRTIPYYRGAQNLAFEESRIDRELLIRCRDEVLALMPEKLKSSLAGRIFDLLIEKAAGEDSLTFGLAASRRQVEQRFGLHNLEIPVSAICDSQHFIHFFLEIARRADEYASIYNRTLADFRRQMDISSPSHPLPELSREEGSVELPFWGWRAGGKRFPLFVKSSGASFEITLDDEPIASFSKGQLDDQWALSGRLKAELSGKAKLRPRALVLTTYQRFFICDVFIHGIGGARYEQIADEIMMQFFGFKPPPYIVLSATLLLPFKLYDPDEASVRELENELRRAQHAPEIFLDEDSRSRLSGLIDEKLSLINVEAPARSKRRAFRRLKEINKALFEKARPAYDEVSRRLKELKKQIQWNEVLARRDYPFCIYPENQLDKFFSDKIKRIG